MDNTKTRADTIGIEKTNAEKQLRSTQLMLQQLEDDPDGKEKRIDILEIRCGDIQRQIDYLGGELLLALDPVGARIAALKGCLDGPLTREERVNIEGIVEILKAGTWGRILPYQPDSHKWIVLVGGKPIRTIEAPSQLSKREREDLVAEHKGSLYFEPPLEYEGNMMLAEALPWPGPNKPTKQIAPGLSAQFEAITAYTWANFNADKAKIQGLKIFQF